MRKQVQQLTARHEVSKKELATSETVGEWRGDDSFFRLRSRYVCVIVTPHLVFPTLRWGLSVFSIVIFIPSFLPQTVLPTPSWAYRLYSGDILYHKDSA